MNHAWHARRAKREIRRGGPIKNMPHLLRIRHRHGTYLAYKQNMKFIMIDRHGNVHDL